MRRGLTQRRAGGPEATIAGEKATDGCEERSGRRAGGCCPANHMERWMEGWRNGWMDGWMDASPCGYLGAGDFFRCIIRMKSLSVRWWGRRPPRGAAGRWAARRRRRRGGEGGGGRGGGAGSSSDCRLLAGAVGAAAVCVWGCVCVCVHACAAPIPQRLAAGLQLPAPPRFPPRPPHRPDPALLGHGLRCPLGFTRGWPDPT